MSRRPRCAPPPRWSSGPPTTSSATSTPTGCCSGPSCTRGDAHSREALLRSDVPRLLLPSESALPSPSLSGTLATWTSTRRAAASMTSAPPPASSRTARLSRTSSGAACSCSPRAGELKPPSRRGPLSEPLCAFPSLSPLARRCFARQASDGGRRGGRAALGGVGQRPRLCGSERRLHLPRGGTGGGGDERGRPRDGGGRSASAQTSRSMCE